jgi:hypothetical protein
MKRPFFIFLLSFFLFCYFFQCKKDDKQVNPVNIVLYNQPLDTIQHYILGKWKLVYTGREGCSGCKYYCNSCFIEFTSTNRVLVPRNDGTFTVDTTIEWIRDIGTYINDSTYLMKFYNKDGYPYTYVIDRIYYDTLEYHDYGSDPFFYHNIKQN